jgi:hypothetical protein
MFRKMLLALGLGMSVVLSVAAQQAEPEKCSCVRVGKETQCNNACMQLAKPDVIAALRKRYPDLQNDDINVFDDGSHQYEVVFYTTKWHMSCRLMLNPIRFRNCHPIHA